MKCIRCGNDSKYPERRGGKCPHCHGEFAFEPREGALLNDVAFQAAIDAVSAEGRVRWGVEHLYYEVCRGFYRKRSPLGCVWVALAAPLLALAMAGSIHAWPLFVVGVPVVIFISIILIRSVRGRRQTAGISVAAFDKMCHRWKSVHGKPKGLIERKQQPAKNKVQEPDLGDYSFDRAVICDRARTVDLLLANNFHFENNCAVVSVEGYPPGPFETVRAMLRRNPRLEVFALHDATPKGCRLARLLANDPAWFQGGVRVIDVGLRSSHAEPLKGLWLKAESPLGEPIEGLSLAENKWLSEYWVELAAERPEQVLKRLFREINRQRSTADTADVSGGDSFAVDGSSGSSFALDAGDSDAGADSFG